METIKGFRDIENASKRRVIVDVIENVFKLYNFQAVETPIIENEKFVVGDNPSDEAVSDVFKLQDKGKRKLALRYEFTFQLKRIAKNKKLPFKRYQIGKVFRDEPVTGNRWREFTQCDADIVGCGLKDESEILKLISDIMNKLGIKFVINFNNRKLLNEILEGEGVSGKDKVLVIKEIDKLDKLSEKEVRANLKKFGAEKVLKIFKEKESYFKKYKSYSEIKDLKDICKLYGVKINFQPFLARGLSYYNGSIFEVKTLSKSGVKETIAAGGSYMVNGVQSCGISFGLDRLELLAKVSEEYKKVLIISFNQDKKAIEVCEKIRELGVGCSVSYGKPGKAMDYANSYNIPLVIFIGEDEIKKKKIKVREMNSGKESFILESKLEDFLGKFG
ncbi:histidine--tRNA ligase [archaeon]|jgi:histidyl-tRNA synthetase|nr:histidine--tRNA ligase [archaeon]MBT4241988.1 histidine--tRNA ligase [archaeon]MBT4418535.1 histidine--tRNA ligase [archaeon]